MNTEEWLAGEFEAHRLRLELVAYRMLGNPADADDAVQEAWFRLSRAGAERIENLGGWLTTAVARVCLDMLRTRTTRREAPLAEHVAETLPARDGSGNPEHEAVLADSIGLALLVVLETLSPAERVAYVLHDMFGVRFEEIAPIVGREPAAARQLASRARRRIRIASKDQDADVSSQREVVEAFLRAAREGDFEGLVALLAPEVVLRADEVAVAAAQANAARGAPPLAPEVRGAREVAAAFAGRADEARPAMIGGRVGAAWVPRGIPRAAFRFSVTGGRITSIEIVANPATVRSLAPAILRD